MTAMETASFIRSSRAVLLACIAVFGTTAARAGETDAPQLAIENRTSETIDNIRLTSGERYLTELWGTETPSLDKGLCTYHQAISAASLGSNVQVRLRCEEVTFRCDTPAKQMPKTGAITCVLTEEGGARKATYIPTPFANYFRTPRKERLAANQVAVMGAVKSPGVFDLSLENTLTLEEALKLAGGIHDGDWLNSAAAVPNKIGVSRIVNGQEHTFTLDGRNTAKDKGKDLEFQILPGDEINVPQLF
jgi:hypothetical protein